MLNIEIDVDTEILDFNPRPPPRTWLDFVPAFVVDFLRKRWGFPNATPRERWFLALLFVKTSLTTLIERDPVVDAHPLAPRRKTPLSELN